MRVQNASTLEILNKDNLKAWGASISLRLDKRGKASGKRVNAPITAVV